jgi:ATP-binding cassette subfamily B protein
MDNLSGYAHRPLPFVLRYLRQRLASHLVIVISVVTVACSVGTPRREVSVDGLSAESAGQGTMWLALFSHRDRRG